ncbi:uncharacterized protein [Anoplolepis gracilipes]|uniref:uncharacterized protein isoform X2 n=1 Tax=Anoplolepis gracilipes TaxID=354296 RepID=UPI003B9E293C
MPYYNDVPYYYGGGAYANHSSLMTGTGRTPFHTPLSRFSPHLSTISESPLNHLHRTHFSVRPPPISVRHTRRVIDTADIDVSSPRSLSHNGSHPTNRLHRNRPTIKIRSQALKDNPVLREHNERHEKSVAELLMEKFFIKDKKFDGNGNQQVRLYHQVGLNRLENLQEQEAVQKRITRRFTRRRSSIDQLNPEQLQQKATYAQVQAKVLDSLVAEEQAQIENEIRQNTLMKDTMTRGSITAHSYYTDSDTMTPQEEEKTATIKIKKTMNKTMKKKKPTIDKPRLTDKTNNKRSNIYSETDSEIEEENNSPKPQMYKIEACNSVGDFSTIWVNASSENEKCKSMVEQFRESAKIPTPKVFEAENEVDAFSNNIDETEMQIVLPVRKPYVKDSSRNSVYLTMKKPTEKLNEKIEKCNRDDNQLNLSNSFIDVKNNIFIDNALNSLTSKDSLEFKDDVQVTNDIKDMTLKKISDKSKNKKEESLAKKNIYFTSDNIDIQNKIVSKTNSDVRGNDKDNAALSKSTEAIMNSIQSNVVEFTSTNAQKNDTQVKQLKLAKNILTDVKKNESQKDDNVINTMKSFDYVKTIEMPEFFTTKDSLTSKIDKRMEEKSKILATSREDGTKRSVVLSEANDNAGKNSANSSTCCLPKPSKINADKNNVVEAPELSLREKAQYLANPPESTEDVVTLPEKKVNKANLAKATFCNASKKINSVDMSKPTFKLDVTQANDVVNLVTKETTLLKEINGEVRNIDRNEEMKSRTDIKPAKVDLTKTLENKLEKTNGNILRKLSIKTTNSSKIETEKITPKISVPEKSNLLNTDIIKVSNVDIGKDALGNADLSNLKSNVPKLDVGKSKFQMKTFPKIDVNETDKMGSSKIKKELDTFKISKINEDKSILFLQKDLDKPKILKKSINDSKTPMNNCSLNLTSNNIPHVQQSTSNDENVADKSIFVKKILEPPKLLNKVTEKKPVIVDVTYDKSQEKDGQLTKSASTEINEDKSILFLQKDLDKPKILKKSINDSKTPMNNCSLNLTSNNILHVQQSTSNDENVADKSIFVKKILEPPKLLNKVTEKKPVIVDVTYDRSQEKGGQLTKSASTEINEDKSILFLQKDLDKPKILKKSINDSKTPMNNCSLNLTSNNIPHVQQSTSNDENVADKSIFVKKILEPPKLLNKVTEKKPVIVDVTYDKSQEKDGQLTKSASTESIDFWSEIKATSVPEEIKSKQESRFSSCETTTPKVEKEIDPTNPKLIFNNSSARKKSLTASMKNFDDKKDRTKKDEAEFDNSTVKSSNVVAEKEKEKEKVILEFPKVKNEEATKLIKTTENEKNMLKMPKKKKNLSIAIDIKNSNSTVKKAPLKHDSAISIQSNSTTSDMTTVATSEVSALIPEVTVPAINIVEPVTLSEESNSYRIDEVYENPNTPTNELSSDLFLVPKISKWSNQDDLTNADDVETPVASEETSLVVSPKVSPQSFKTKHSNKKKKASSKKMPLTKSEKEMKIRSNESTITSQQNTLTSEKQLLTKPSPRTSPKSSPRNTPSQRPLDLIRMFYTTPSALLTATPRDLTKIRRAKIKKRRHHSKTSSVNSDSTGSTTSTATTESTDGSGSTCIELDNDSDHKNSTRSNDSGFDGSPRILTPSQSSDNQRNSDTSDRFPSGRITPPATNLPRFKKYAVTDFNFLKVLGKGSFGKVLLAELCGTECVYAVKCLKKDVVLEDDDVECTLIERKVLTLATRHPYLCHLFCTFQTDSHLFFVMEYLNGGDLMFHIQKSGRFPETRARFYAAEIWSGLSFLHKKGIVYRDLKLDNVLLDFEGHIRIADFGMCKLQIFLDRTADTFCGTPDYMAPEIIKGLKYNHSVDWWSYGVLLYEMLTGQSPFSGCDEDELFWSICNERPFIPRYLSQEATDILVCLLEKDSGKRLPAHEIAMHAFFQHLPWDRLERRQLEPPFKPALDHTLDTKYFDTAFTTERPRLTPVPEQILTSMDQNVFRGFSYTNPNATD